MRSERTKLWTGLANDFHEWPFNRFLFSCHSAAAAVGLSLSISRLCKIKLFLFIVWIGGFPFWMETCVLLYDRQQVMLNEIQRTSNPRRVPNTLFHRGQTDHTREARKHALTQHRKAFSISRHCAVARHCAGPATPVLAYSLLTFFRLLFPL